MGLCYQTTRWLDRLWAEHLEMSQPARHLLEAGIKKQGPPFAGFPADLHARLYLPSDPPSTKAPPEWAARLHRLATELGEWQRLRALTARNGFAAGIAAEVMLQELSPHVPERSRGDGGEAQDERRQNAGNPQERPEQYGPGPAAPADSHDSSQPRSGSDRTDGDIRASLRRALRAARTAVEEAEAGLEGLATPLYMHGPGTAVVHQAGPADMRRIRDAHFRLSGSRRLHKIAEIAGRLERAAATKLRSKVKPGVGELHGIDFGGDLARLLPSEIVALRRPRLRLALLARLLERRALCYSMQGRQPQARGPIVVLLDESGSMREGGERSKDVWSKAVALALLSTATKQRRAWHLIGFNGAITREITIAAGRATAADIQQALDHGCSGGTDFDAPVLRAIEIIRTSPTMRQADVVIISDGEDELEPTTVDAATALTRSEGVSWFCVGVGLDEVGLQALAPIATNMVRVRSTEDADDLIAPVINLEK